MLSTIKNYNCLPTIIYKKLSNLLLKTSKLETLIKHVGQEMVPTQFYSHLKASHYMLQKNLHINVFSLIKMLQMQSSLMMKNIFLVLMVLKLKVEISKIIKYGVHLNNTQSKLSQLNIKMYGVLSNGQDLNQFKFLMEKFIFILLHNLKQLRLLLYRISNLLMVLMIIQQELSIMGHREIRKLKQEKLVSIQSI